MGGIGFDMKIVGLKEVAQKMKPETVQKPLAEGLSRLRMWLEGEVKKATPVDTGRLRGSISSDQTANTVKIGTTVHYASYVEYGTARMEPRHMEGGSRVKGKGMFAYALGKLQERISAFIKDIGEAIEVQFK